jgi:EAL domain-containing protein (putative c-di-GMP-specific phosphodiesterase class I)
LARILVVDPDEKGQAEVRRILGAMGHVVVSVSSGAAALAASRKERFDASLIDAELPDGDGPMWMQALKEAQPLCARIMVTGRLDLPVAIRAVNLGEVSRVIRRPYPPQVLVDALEGCLHRSVATDMAASVASIEDDDLRTMLFNCLKGDEMRLAIQPIVQAKGGAVMGHEALIRSAHPILKRPDQIVELSERIGLLSELGNMVMERACEWLGRLLPETSLFVNLHPSELQDHGALRQRLGPLVPHAERVVLEVTGRGHERWPINWSEGLEGIREMGFSFALDDLGAGYSALSILAELGPRYVKVDMSVIRGMDLDPRKRRLVDLLCRFADASQALLIAEGVETEAEAEALRSAGVPLLQGYLFGRPQLEMAS